MPKSQCEWVFKNEDGSKEVVILNGKAPSIGDGKAYNGKGYVVKSVISGRTTSPIPRVIATEVP